MSPRLAYGRVGAGPRRTSARGLVTTFRAQPDPGRAVNVSASCRAILAPALSPWSSPGRAGDALRHKSPHARGSPRQRQWAARPVGVDMQLTSPADREWRRPASVAFTLRLRHVSTRTTRLAPLLRRGAHRRPCATAIPTTLHEPWRRVHRDRTPPGPDLRRHRQPHRKGVVAASLSDAPGGGSLADRLGSACDRRCDNLIRTGGQALPGEHRAQPKPLPTRRSRDWPRARAR